MGKTVAAIICHRFIGGNTGVEEGRQLMIAASTGNASSCEWLTLAGKLRVIEMHSRSNSHTGSISAGQPILAKRMCAVTLITHDESTKLTKHFLILALRDGGCSVTCFKQSSGARHMSPSWMHG